MPLRYVSIWPWTIAILALLHGCSSVPSAQYFDELPASSLQLEVPFFPQTEYYCGPAAMASMLSYRGVDAQPEQLVRRVYLPGRQGSLNVEMQAAPRGDGLLSYRLAPELDALLTELAAGNPVLVLQNLSFNWFPRWHYAVVVGYERDKRQLILHSGTRENHRLPLRTFMNTWQRVDNWALVITRPDNIPASATALRFLSAASDLEQVGKTDAAASAYGAAMAHWPDNSSAQFAYANHLLSREEHAQAYEHFMRALEIDVNFAPAWNNLAFALSGMGCDSAALKAVQQARKLAPEDDRYATSERDIRQARTGGEQPASCPP